jgi:cell division protease FtsH
MAQAREYSDEVAHQIDLEIRKILDNAHDEAYKALNVNRRALDAMAKELMEKETLNQDDIARIFKGIKKAPKRKPWLSKVSRPGSKKGPIAIPSKGSTTSKVAAKKKADAQNAKDSAKAASKKKSKPAETKTTRAVKKK